MMTSTDWSMLLFVLGLVFMILELAVVPGTTAFGILGTFALFASLYFFLGAGIYAFSHILYFIVGILVVALVIFFILPNSLWRKFALFHASSGSKPLYDHLLHQEGITLTPLYPSGTAEFSGQRVSVVSEGLYIRAQKKVQVIHVDGSRIVVREIGNIES